MMVLTIAQREWRSLFLSPLAWTMLAVIQFIMAYLFLAQLDYYLVLQPRMGNLEDVPGTTDMVVTPLFGNAAVILLLVTPLLTMRLVCEERRNRTLSLLLSAPVSMMEIALGKFLGVFGFLMLIVILLLMMPLSLLAGGSLDAGKLLACGLALSLLLASFSAVGLYLSSLASHPTVAAISTFGALLLFWIIDWTGNSNGKSHALVEYLSMLRHYESMLKGLMDTTDIVYFLLIMTTFLVLTVHRLDSDRLQK